MSPFESLWNFFRCKQRRGKLEISEMPETDEEDAFLLEDDPECAELSDQQIITQILAASSSNFQTEPSKCFVF